MTDGDVVVYDSTRPFAVHAQRRFDLVVCGVPLALLGGQADRMRDLSATRIPRSAAVARMFASFVEGIADELGGDGLAGAELELADTLVAFSRALARREDVRAGARLRSVQAWIDAHLGDPGLSPTRIAAANFVSVRTLHRLFEARGRHRVGLAARPSPGGLPARPGRPGARRTGPSRRSRDAGAGTMPPASAAASASVRLHAERGARYALSVSLRGPERNPSSTEPPRRRADDRLAVDALERELAPAARP